MWTALQAPFAPTICHMNARVTLRVDAIGRRAAQRRENLRLEQEDVATRAGMSRAYVSRLENGMVKAPKVTDLAAIAGALDVTLDTLLYDDPVSTDEADLKRSLSPYLGMTLASDVAQAIAAAPELTESERQQLANVVVALTRHHMDQRTVQ